MQYRVFVKQPEEKQLDCQTFKGYAYRRACDFQLSYIKDSSQRREGARLAKGTTNEEAFNKLQSHIDEQGIDCIRVFVEPYQREKTPEELARERQLQMSERLSNVSGRSGRVKKSGFKYLFDYPEKPRDPPVIPPHGGPPLTLDYESSDEGSSDDDSTTDNEYSRSAPSVASVLYKIRRVRKRRRRYFEEERPIKIKRVPIFIPFSAMKPTAKPRYFLRA